MPSFWNASSSEVDSSEKDFSGQFLSPTSSNTLLFRRDNSTGPRKISNSYETKRSTSQAGIIDALMSPRQVLSPSSSKIIHPSQSASTVGVYSRRVPSRYVQRQVSLDNSSSDSTAANEFTPFPINDHRSSIDHRNSIYEMNNDSFGTKLPQELSFVTLRRPYKRYDTSRPNKDEAVVNSISKNCGPITDTQVNHFPLTRQMSGSSSTSTIGGGNILENDATTRIGLDYSVLKEKCNNGRNNKSLIKSGSSYSSICSTLGENEEEEE